MKVKVSMEFDVDDPRYALDGIDDIGLFLMNFCNIFHAMRDYFSERLMATMCDKSLDKLTREAAIGHLKADYELSKQIFENAFQIEGKTLAGDTFHWSKVKDESGHRSEKTVVNGVRLADTHDIREQLKEVACKKKKRQQLRASSKGSR